MPSPSFNTFRKINYQNPQYQQAMLDARNRSDYSVNPDTRAITNQYIQSEANRIRGLDEFGIQNRMMQEALAFNKNMQNKRMALEFAKIADERKAMKDAQRGADLGMLIQLGQAGMNMYDDQQTQAIRQMELEELRRQRAAYDASTSSQVPTETDYVPLGFYDPSRLNMQLGRGL